MKDCSFIIVVILFLFQLYPDVNATAYDNQITHRYINEMAVKNKADIDSYLKTSLGMHDGIHTVIGTKRIWEWISDGGEKEDDPESRCPKHFHDPLSTNWDNAGLSIPPLGYFPSMIYWAQSSDNEYSWLLARDYYYQALLTGSEEQYARTFRAMGQLMHLVSDAAVPAHVRNDAHLKFDLFSLGIVKYDDSDPYENWVRQKHSKIESMEFNDFIVNRAIFDMAVENTSASSPISALWDHDEYKLESNPPDDSDTAIGLAEYTNANFWTEDTFPWNFNSGNYPHPALENINYDENVWLNPEKVDAEDGVTDKRIYFSKIADETGTPFLAAGYWYWQLYMWNKPEFDHAFLLDEKCYEQYAEKLIPRAIGYSTALLDYFFRGRLEVSACPYFQDNVLSWMKLNLTNTTETEDAMLDGDFSLVFKYTPINGNPDGSDDIIVHSKQNVHCDQLLFNESTDVYFQVSQEIPIECWDSVTCTLVFQGTLGAENDAIVGKVFHPGKILFNEEWDKGITGNHDWIPTPEGTNIDNGTSTLTVSSGSLVMENFRQEDSDDARVNELYLDFTADGSDGLLITPTTCVQFLIPEMYTTTTDSRYYTHALLLIFDNNLTLQYVGDGTAFHWNDTTVSLAFTTGSICVDNIMERFQNTNFPIPDNLHLKYISFLQQAYRWEGEYYFHLDVDAIRLIDTELQE